jgi:putative hydrolase of HD superfamily
MEASKILSLMMHGNQLKRTVRTGWIQRGISQQESVAAHSYGVTFIALVMADVIPESFDLESVLAMGIVHDLPEGLTSDIPTPAWGFMPSGTKLSVEAEAMGVIAGDLQAGRGLVTFWAALQENESAEARLIHDCDKLDMFLQAYMYEQQTGTKQLAEFWEKDHKFEFKECQAVYDRLASLRNQE